MALFEGAPNTRLYCKSLKCYLEMILQVFLIGVSKMYSIKPKTVSIAMASVYN